MLARRLQTAGLAVMAQPGDAGRTDWASLSQSGQNSVSAASYLADMVTSS